MIFQAVCLAQILLFRFWLAWPRYCFGGFCWLGPDFLEGFWLAWFKNNFFGFWLAWPRYYQGKSLLCGSYATIFSTFFLQLFTKFFQFFLWLGPDISENCYCAEVMQCTSHLPPPAISFHCDDDGNETLYKLSAFQSKGKGGKLTMAMKQKLFASFQFFNLFPSVSQTESWIRILVSILYGKNDLHYFPFSIDSS